MPSSSSSYDLVVIGGGSAGLTAAKFAAKFGKSAVIIEKAKLGGDCTFYGCIPSKSLLASAKVAHVARSKSKKFGIRVGGISVDTMEVRNRIQANIKTIYDKDDSPEAMQNLGVDTIEGSAKLEDEKSVIVSNEQGETLLVKANCGVVIATGAGPKQNIDDEIPGLSQVKYLTYEEAFNLEELPGKMTVVGGGPIGCELAQAFSRLGADVTIIAPRLLPGEEPEISDALKTVFEKEGIRLIESKLKNVQSESKGSHKGLCMNGEAVAGDTLLVAIGRQPIVEGLGLEKLGIELNSSGGIKVDDDLRTSVGSIYAAGDVTGDRQFTHYAGYQGAISARNILLPLKDDGKLSSVPATTFTDPEISSIGMSEKDAREEFGDEIDTAVKHLNDTDRGVCEGSEEGIIKIIYKKRSNQILGAHMMTPGAGDMIAEIAILMKFGIPFDKLATVMHTYPSNSIILQQMAAEVYYAKLAKSKGVYNFLKRIGL